MDGPLLSTLTTFIASNIDLFSKLFCAFTLKNFQLTYLAVEEELRKSGDFGKIEHRYLLSLIDATFTIARAEYHANIIKEKANLRKLIELSNVLIDEAERGEKSFADIIAYAQNQFSSWSRYSLPSKSSHLADYFANQLKADIDSLKNYAVGSPDLKILMSNNFSVLVST